MGRRTSTIGFGGGTRSAWLEYSIYLPRSFLKPGGEHKAYPLVLGVTHSGTSYDGTCARTLTEQCIATIWSLPDYWEHNPRRREHA